MTAVAELSFLDMFGERSLPEWIGRSTEMRPTPLGRGRWFMTIGCSSSAPLSSLGMRERPLSQSLTFLAASAKVKFECRPVVR
jgi:hypothetical protein